MKEHPGIARAMSYLQKVMVISPKDGMAPAEMYSVYRFTRDDAALAALEQRLRAAQIDTADELAHLKEFLDGSKDQQNQNSINAALKREQDASAAVAGKGGVTAALALDQQLNALLSLDASGGTVDADKIVALAEQANQLASSEGTLTADSAERISFVPAWRCGNRIRRSISSAPNTSDLSVSHTSLQWRPTNPDRFSKRCFRTQTCRRSWP